MNEHTYADRLLADHLDRVAAGADESLDDLCLAHPEHAEALRSLHARWLSVSGLVGALGAAGAREPDAGATTESGPPVQLGRYRVDGEVGRGGMGAVLAVWDDDLRRQVAMKVTRGGPGSDSDSESLRARFVEEAQVTGQLDHPGIVPVHELGRDDQGRPYFTMQLVREGRTLEEAFDDARAQRDGWTRERALDAVLKVCEAMAFAHEKGVLHRDLKPSNVMVGRFGETYVMDWGLAKVRGSGTEPGDAVASDRSSDGAQAAADPESPLVTKSGTVLGTPTYMSPEQARGDELTAATDVYAAGALLYRLLAGHAPYCDGDRERRSASQLLLRLLQGPPTPVGRLASDAPPELIAICERAMEREPGDRYADMVAMADDLRAFLERRVVRAYRTGALVEFRKWVERNRALAATAAASILIVIGLSSAGALVVSAKNRDLVDANDLLEERTAEAQNERETAEELVAFLERDLLAAVAPSAEAGRGRDVTMREALDVASRRMPGRFEGRPTVEARLADTLGRTYLQLGEFGPAEPHLRRAVELYDTVGDPRARFEVERKLVELLSESYRLAEAEELIERMRASPVLSERDDAAWVDLLSAVVRLRQGRLLESVELRRGACELLERTHAPDSLDVLYARSALVSALTDLGEWEEALVVVEDCLRAARASDEPRADLLELELSGKLGIVLAELHEFERAEEVFRGMREDGRELLGEDHPVTLSALASIATSLSRQGKAEAAEELARACLERRREVLGEDHPFTLEVAALVATTVRLQGRTDESRALFEQNVQRTVARLGENHPRTASVRYYLGSALSDLGLSAEAEVEIRNALAVRTEQLGPDHPDTFTAQNGLAVVLVAQQRYDEAEELYLEVLEGQRRALPEGHPNTLQTQYNLATLLRRLQQYDRAEELLLECIEGRELALGPDHRDTITAINYLAYVYKRAGRPDDAGPRYLEAWEKARDALGEHDDDTLHFLYNLSVFHFGIGELDRAAELQRLYAESVREARGELDPSHVEAVRGLASILRRAGRTEEAEPVLGEHARYLAELHGPAHADAVRARRQQGAALLDLGRWAEAETLHRELWELCREEVDAGDPSPLFDLNQIAATLFPQDRGEESIELLELCLAKRRELQGDEHEDTLFALTALTNALVTLGRTDEAETWLETYVEGRADDAPLRQEVETVRERIGLAGDD